MTNHAFRPTAARTARSLLLTCGAAALLAACGGGEALAPDAGATQATPGEQMALNRAVQANKDALATRVKGERAPRQAAQ